MTLSDEERREQETIAASLRTKLTGMLSEMIEQTEVERLRRHLVALTRKADDADAFAIVAAMQDEWSTILAAQARKLNGEGVPWSEIAAPLGVDRRTAHHRYAAAPSAKGYRGSRGGYASGACLAAELPAPPASVCMPAGNTPVETGAPWRSPAEAEWDASR